jgi:ribonuclease BN (tRNA processing enzyme)
MRLTVIGSGDAFGSGGRLQTCFALAFEERHVLLDCGVTALIGFERLGRDPGAVDTIVISHLHGDHFGGLVWFVLHASLTGRRRAPLAVIGPPTIARRFAAASEALFPGSTGVPRTFALAFHEFEVGGRREIAGLAVTALEVDHPSGAPSCAVRIEAGGRTLAYSGDTQWCEALVPAAAGADLFICECYGFDRDVPYHLSWRRIESALDRLAARRILLTHMGPRMLERRGEITDPRVTCADDGLVLDV